MTVCGALLPAGSSSRRGWLLAAQLLLVTAAILTLLMLFVMRMTDKSERVPVVSGSGGGACQRRREAMLVLPPVPQSDQEIIANLVHHLTLPSDKPCQRELQLGGEPHEFPSGSVAVLGIKSVCLDPGLSLARPDCLVVASRPALEASFDAAAALFGCDVHSYGPDRGRQLEPSLAALPGGQRPVSLLALQLDVAQLAGLLRRPPATLRRVEQLTVRLNLTAALTGGAPGAGDVSLLRHLYGGLLRLQSAGFYPFSSVVVEAEGVLDVTLDGQEEAMSTAREIGWMKVLCDD